MREYQVIVRWLTTGAVVSYRKLGESPESVLTEFKAVVAATEQQQGTRYPIEVLGVQATEGNAA